MSRGAIPLTRENVASFRAPRETLPSRPGKLRARRKRGDLIVAGMRYDLRTGRYRRISLAEDQKRKGPGGRLPRRICA